MTKQRIAIVLFLVFGAIVVGLITKDRGLPGGGWKDRLDDLFNKKDSIAVATLERQRDSLDAVIAAARDSFTARIRGLEQELDTATAVASRRAILTARAKARADSLVRAMRAHADDDDYDAKRVDAAIAAKDSVIEAQAWQLEAANAQILILSRSIQTRDERIAELETHLADAIRQRDSYRKFGKRDWLRASLVAAGTIAVCRAIPDPC